MSVLDLFSWKRGRGIPKEEPVTETKPNDVSTTTNLVEDDDLPIMTVRGATIFAERLIASYERKRRTRAVTTLAVVGIATAFLVGIFFSSPNTNTPARVSLDEKVLATGLPVLGALPTAKEDGHIVVIRLSGVIDGAVSEDPSPGNTPLFLLEAFAQAEKDPKLAGIILEINSPGGSATASEKGYQVVREARERLLRRNIRLIAHTETGAYSGGYFIAMGVGKGNFFADSGASVANIGVIMKWFNTAELGRFIGVKENIFKTGELKSTGSQWEELSKDQRAMVETNLADTFETFMVAVHEGRGIPIETLRKEAKQGSGRTNGGWFSARRAKELDLIDGIIPAEVNFKTPATEMLPDKKRFRSVGVVAYTPARGFFEALSGKAGTITGQFLQHVNAVLTDRHAPLRMERE